MRLELSESNDTKQQNREGQNGRAGFHALMDDKRVVRNGHPFWYIDTHTVLKGCKVIYSKKLKYTK